MSVCSPMTAYSTLGVHTAVEANYGSWAGGQVCAQLEGLAICGHGGAGQ